MREFWNWFFEEDDSISASVIRVGFAAIFLFMLWDLYPILHLLMGHSGIYGTLRPEYLFPILSWNPLYHYDGFWALEIWFWLTVLCSGCALLGIASSWTVRLTYLSSFLFFNRVPFGQTGADQVLQALGFWMLFLDFKSRRIPHWPLKAMQIQIALIYFIAAAKKLSTETWTDGSALYHAFQYFGNRHGLTPYLLNHHLLLTLMSFAALGIELAFAFLVFRKSTRWLALGSVFLLHFGIDMSMSIRFFSLTMYLGLLSFVQPAEWRNFSYFIQNQWILLKSNKTVQSKARTVATAETTMCAAVPTRADHES